MTEVKFVYDITTDRTTIHDATKAILSVIFFHRLFGPVEAQTCEFLDVPYPTANYPALDIKLEAAIDELIRTLDSNACAPNLSSSQESVQSSMEDSRGFGTAGDTLSIGKTIGNSEDPWPMRQAAFNSTAGVSRTVSNTGISTASSNNSSGKNGSNGIKFGQVVLQFFDKRRVKKPTWFGRSEEEICWETWILNVKCVPNGNSDDGVLKRTTTQFRNIILSIIETVSEKKDHIPPITTTDIAPFPYTLTVTNNSHATWKEYIRKMIESASIP